MELLKAISFHCLEIPKMVQLVKNRAYLFSPVVLEGDSSDKKSGSVVDLEFLDGLEQPVLDLGQPQVDPLPVLLFLGQRLVVAQPRRVLRSAFEVEPDVPKFLDLLDLKKFKEE